MRLFLLKILSIALCILVPLIIADHVMSKNYQNRNYYPFTTMTNIVEGRLDSDLWILGSSRALVQYNPRILDSMLSISCYNLGMNAQFIVPELQCYYFAREYNEKPQYIILDMMWKTLTTEKSFLPRYFYMPYINNLKVRKVLWQNNIFTKPYLYIPYYRFYTEHKTDIYYQDDTIIYKGFCANNSKWNAIDIEVLDTINFRHETAAIELLNTFITECHKENIKVILIHSPFYHKGFEKIHGNDDMMKLFRNLAIENDVLFLDYTNDPISYDTMNFYNNMHLNAHGADIFSAKLAHDLDSLGLIPSRK